MEILPNEIKEMEGGRKYRNIIFKGKKIAKKFN